jgi:hypothetical protein
MRKKLSKAIRSRTLYLGLLQTSMLINLEAAEIFYGMNEFRFSGVHGHIAAAVFAYTIGPRNLSWIHMLTVVLPIRSGRRSSHNFFPISVPFNEYLDQTLFRYPRYEIKWHGVEASLILLTELLIVGALRLEQLVFVLPEYLLLRPAGEQHWDAIKELICRKRFLSIDIVRMFMPTSNIYTLHGGHRWLVSKLKNMASCSILFARLSEIERRTLGTTPGISKYGGFIAGGEMVGSKWMVDAMDV